MGKRNVTFFIENVVFPSCEKKSLLLLGSWSGHSKIESLSAHNEIATDIQILKIPPGTTNLIQPLDKEFFRQWKPLYRKITEKIIVSRQADFHAYQRDSILKLQSFIHYQFSSPRFRNIIRYAWYAAQYVDERPASFVTPAQYCCHITEQLCEIDFCESSSFIICSWCKKNLCFNHCIIQSHFCKIHID